jgi:hypothetical protein
MALEYIPEDLLIYQQGYGLTKYLYENFNNFCLGDYNRIYLAHATKRYAKKVDAPALVITWDDTPREQEDVSLADFLPMGAFTGTNVPTTPSTTFPLGEAARLKFNITVRIIPGDDVVIPFNSTLWGTFPQIEGLPAGIVGSEASAWTNVAHVALTWQRVTNRWTIDYYAKVLDPTGEKYSLTAFLSQARKYFPLNIFKKIVITDLPMNDRIIYSFAPSIYFMLKLTRTHITKSRFETALETEDRQLIGTLEFETQQFMLCAWPADAQKYFPPFISNPYKGAIYMDVPFEPDPNYTLDENKKK